ncbi:phage terminase large subunit family protein [Bradyrhizobium barranii subsp. apii]|uniref:Phage terminase large subunit family protein n=1 Tax=Bradyrhizobium barranii subsp. apii TaxID=2819348 RepID=A0A8U0FXJ4_9BRAD|nr:terminase gpA endonuclease subunit [Bradyrhizobium barranii]UPT91111.1 phage terminase large subunit family protein [Bradyrhizobium barranii subsp. apii]UPT99222.1 phage terminase large subunit family protein [Bradyrhizobium barranii subsp. apii]
MPSSLIASAEYKRIVLAFGAQTGKTEMILDVVGQRLDQRPAPILYVGPNKQFLSEQFEPRVMALLDEAPTLTAKVARGKRMTKTRKVVGGVPFRLAHAGSSTALKSDPAALALVDEYDEMRNNVNHQGGPLGLVERRGDTYADFVCVVTSTPKRGRLATVKDETSGLFFWEVAVAEDIESPIWQLWQQGTRHHWSWPCPHCDEYFVPRFDLLRFPLKATPLEAARETFLECPRCHGVIEDHHKTEMNARGRYVAPGQTIDKDGIVHGAPPDAMAASFWVSGLASPFVSFGERVAVLVEAQQSGDPAMVQQAINAGFGELYSPGGGEVPEWMEIKTKSQQATYKRGEVPEDVLYLTLTCDVQRQSIPWVIRGWGARATSWLINYGYLRGDTSEAEIWAALGDLVTQPIDGLPIRLTFIDSGFRPGKTDTLPLNRVYEFCRRFMRRVRPTKGSSSPMRTPLIFSKLEVSRKDGRAAKYGLELVRLDTDHWKSWVHERLRWPEDHIGGWHVFKGIDDDYCHQLVSEARLKQPTGRVEWVQRSRDNHFFDCEAMQAAAGYLLNVQRIPLQKTHDRNKDGVGTQPETPSEVESAREAPPVPHARSQDQAHRQIELSRSLVAPCRAGRPTPCRVVERATACARPCA